MACYVDGRMSVINPLLNKLGFVCPQLSRFSWFSVRVALLFRNAVKYIILNYDCNIVGVMAVMTKMQWCTRFLVS